MRFGIQGDHGSFSEAAALDYITRHRINNYTLEYLVSSMAVLTALNNNRVDYGIIAIKNSIGGTVKESREALECFETTTIDEFSIAIHQNLLSLPTCNANEVTEIHSHPQALKQSSTFLDTNFKNIKLVEAKDTALAARQLKNGALPKTAAVIGNINAATEYELIVLFKSIENDKQNRTTFHCIRKKTSN